MNPNNERDTVVVLGRKHYGLTTITTRASIHCEDTVLLV